MPAKSKTSSAALAALRLAAPRFAARRISPVNPLPSAPSAPKQLYLSPDLDEQAKMDAAFRLLASTPGLSPNMSCVYRTAILLLNLKDPDFLKTYDRIRNNPRTLSNG